MSVILYGYEVPGLAALPLLISILAAAKFGLTRSCKVATFFGRIQRESKAMGATEFGGPFGTCLIMVFLPLFCYFLYFSCNKYQCVGLIPFTENFMAFKVNPFANGLRPLIASLFDAKAFAFYILWWASHMIMYLIVPGKWVKGLDLQDGKGTRLDYKINATQCMFLSYAILTGLVHSGYLSATYIYDAYPQLLTAAITFSLLLTAYLYIYSLVTVPYGTPESEIKNPLHRLARAANTGYIPYDLWLGRTLNPRIGLLDLKYVCELRPGLILWTVINFSMAAKQLQLASTDPATAATLLRFTYGGHEYVLPSASMLLVCASHFYYVLDALINEECILTTMDIVSDGFGYMLAFGDLTWVPFTYSLQARYIVDHPIRLSPLAIAGILGVKILGMYIFRSSNSQKNTFRSNPNHPSVAHLKYLDTKRGTRLLISSWWGMSRHINYFGDIIVGISWCLPCGFSHIIPYFYAIYFTALLVNRQERDDHACKLKYGADWDTYCAKVPYKIVPYIY